HLQTRHVKFRSSFFSAARGFDKPNGFSRDLTAATEALGAASSRDSSYSETVEGRTLELETLRDATPSDSTSEYDPADETPPPLEDVPGSDGAGAGGGDDEHGGGEGSDEEDKTDEEEEGEGVSAAQRPYKGKHWSSAAASCVLDGSPPSPRAAAAVEAHAAAREAELAGGGRLCRGRGNDFRRDGVVLLISSASSNVGAGVGAAALADAGDTPIAAAPFAAGGVGNAAPGRGG
ncbi:unnamed protein product, partial [Scytosiphon promiscuus]